MMTRCISKLTQTILLILILSSSQAYGAFINVSGYVGLLSGGVYNSSANATDDYLATEFPVALDFVVRPGDLVALHLDLRLSHHDEPPLFGEDFGPLDSEADFHFFNDLTPRVSEVYVEASTKLCLINAGRRARNVGLGMFFNDASEPFSATQTLFDGISCEVNTGTVKQLGFTLGVDKLREGDPNNNGDDLQQFFASISFDERKTNSIHQLSKQVTLYFAYLNSASPHDFGEQQDKYLDIHTGLYWKNLSWESEALLRMGQASGSSWESYGGRADKLASVGSFAFYTTFKFTFPAPDGEPEDSDDHDHGSDNVVEHGEALDETDEDYEIALE